MEPISLIYGLLVLHLTIEEANWAVDRLGLSSRVDPSHLTGAGVMSPRDVGRVYLGFDGGVRTSHLLFTVCSNLLILDQIQGPNGAQDWRDDNGRQGVPHDTVSDGMAYDLARGWLGKLEIDVAEMEKKYPPRIEHWRLPITTRKTVSSRFTVKWGEKRVGTTWLPMQEVSLNASKKWLVGLYLRDLTFCRHARPQILHDVAINLLPDEPVRRLLNSPPGNGASAVLRSSGIRFTNAFSLLEAPAGYEEGRRRLLLAETKSICAILDCADLDEFKEENLTDIYVHPPAFGYGGRVEFKHAEIRFDSRGRMQYFYFRPRQIAEPASYAAWLRTGRAVISTNEALYIASQKLTALGVDVEGLERGHQRTVQQSTRLKRDQNGRQVSFQTPLYWVQWRTTSVEHGTAIAKLAIYADTKRIAQLELNDTSYAHRQIQPIPDQQGRQ